MKVHSSVVVTVFGLALPFVLVACGSGDTPATPAQSGTLTGTLAYVVSECRENSAGIVFNQSLLIRQGEHDPIVAMEVPEIDRDSIKGLCSLLTRGRVGLTQAAGFGVFQRLGVSPDGSVVAFELSDEFSSLGHDLLTPGQRGLFVIRADGTGLRRLGPPSRLADFTTGFIFSAISFEFSPGGRTLTFPDLGPGPDGEDAAQVVAQDIATGTRTQVTRLPVASPAPDAPPDPGGMCCPRFLDDQTILFFTEANPDGLNAEGEEVPIFVNADGSGGLRLVPPLTALAGSVLDPRFAITGAQPISAAFDVPGQPVNATGQLQAIMEIFFFDGGQNFLQLTNFHRADTGRFPGDARQRVFFKASADPLGTNPSNNCQIFSIAPEGGDLRQLTQFREGDQSRAGCGLRFLARPLGCVIDPLARDINTGALVFHSTCDPFGTNPNGGQIFAMGADGNGLRQLTTTRGVVRETDGTVIAELPGPYAYTRVGRPGL